MIRFGSPKLGAGGTAKAEVKATSVVVGLKPTLHQLSPGKYPRGALVGVHAPHDPRQSICPPKGVAENILFRIYALPRKLKVKKSSHGSGLVGSLKVEALETGSFIAGYRST